MQGVRKSNNVCVQCLQLSFRLLAVRIQLITGDVQAKNARDFSNIKNVFASSCYALSFTALNSKYKLVQSVIIGHSTVFSKLLDRFVNPLDEVVVSTNVLLVVIPDPRYRSRPCHCLSSLI